MVQLKDLQVDIIAQRISQDHAINPNLKNGLLDHYCCFIEEEMDNGNDFEMAYQHAFKAITPNGAYEIQEELFFLLTFKKQINMKRIIYGAGFFAAFLISVGLMFKTMHWPGASALMFSGFAALIVTLTSLLYSSLKNMRNYSTDYNVRIIAGFIAGVLISTGSMFKTLNYPTANKQLLVGMVVLNLVFLPLFFYQLYKQSIAKI